MLQVIAKIAPQVDRVFVALNEYDEIPEALLKFRNVEAVIPKKDLKDAGKFAFPVALDDIVFTIDDDIIYPEDYVENMLKFGDQIGLDNNIIGYQANAWVYKKRQDGFGWRNHLFFKPCKKIYGVDVIGTGTACMAGKNMPRLEDIQHSKGYIDVGFSLWQRERGNLMWTLPRVEDELARNLPDELQDSTLFNKFARHPALDMRSGYERIKALSAAQSGKVWKP